MPSLSWNETRDRAIAFAREYKDASHEEMQKHQFWIDFFQCFGVPLKAVAVFEKAVENLKGNYGFLDLFWPGVLLVEHKSRGASLDKASSQAFAYLSDLARQGKHDQLPRFVILCDFARFVLFDLEPDDQKALPLFDTGKAYRTVEFPLAELHKHIKEFAFIRGEKTVRLDPESPANMEATQLLAELHDALHDSGLQGHTLERLLVRILFCLFAEDTGIFDLVTFTRLVQRTREDGSDLGLWLAQLFQVLNTPEPDRQRNLDDDLAAFPYVNGGLFAEALPIATFTSAQRAALLKCCLFYWARISPAVFGSLFQGILDGKERRQLGAHYTTERDILKLLRALFLDDLRTELDTILADRSTRRTERLRDFQKKLRRLRIFDPACGCGNFLILAYRELRRLENATVTALHTVAGKVQQVLNVRDLIHVDVDQFYGLEIGEWPVRIAEVGLWLADHQCNVELAEALGQTFRRLPLRATPTIKVANALREDWRAFLPPHDDILIVGNPPFIGKKEQNPEQKADMAAVWGEVKSAGVLDYVTAWYLKAAQYITSSDEPRDALVAGPSRPPEAQSASANKTSFGVHGAGTAPLLTGHSRIRVAFVSTNSICQGEQVGILWSHLFQRYHIKLHFAHRTFTWASEASGKAHVHVVIIGFGAFDHSPKHIYEYADAISEPIQRQVSSINAYLVDAANVVCERRMQPLCDAPPMVFGTKIVDDGHFVLTREERDAFAAQNPDAAPFLRPFIGGDEFLNGTERFVLWLKDAPPALIRNCSAIAERVERVRAFRAASKKGPTVGLAMIPAMPGEDRQPSSDYLLFPKVSSERRRYMPLGFISADFIANGSSLVVPNASVFHFGILSSSMHMAWMAATCGRLESRFQYSNTIVYNNYPWPTPLAERERQAIETSAQAVLTARAAYPASTLADLYDPLSMPAPLAAAHAALDRAVDRAYAVAHNTTNHESRITLTDPFPTDRARVEHLFALYERLTAPLLPTNSRRQRKKPAKQAM